MMCDIMISPEYEATSTTQLHTPNWYDIEQAASYWYDRSNIWVVQGNAETVISPVSGKLYPAGNFYNYSGFCNQGSDKPGWAGAGTTWGDSVFNLSSYAGQKFRIRAKYMTDDLTHGEGIYFDDLCLTNVKYPGCDQQSDTCTGSNPPGSVPDNNNHLGQPLTISKSGNDLQLSWSAPGGTCVTSNYGIYRGNLLWSAYNHSPVLCNTGGTTSATVPMDSGSYYYLVAAQNEGKEGSYGMDSSGTERPASSSPCLPQQIGTCN